MQDIFVQNETQKGFKIEELSIEDKQRLVGAFVWLIEEDKKQNPALYSTNKVKNYD